MDHFCAGVLVLAGVGESDGDHLAAGALALHDHAGVFHGEAGADVAIDPTHLRILHREAALGDEVEDVGRPVLDGDVLDLRAFQGDQLDDCGVQRRCLEFRRGAAFHIHYLGAFVGDDEGALELAEGFRIDAEIGLQRLLELYALGDVDEGAAGKHRAVEGGILIVAGGNDFPEPRAEDFLMLFEPLRGSHEDHPLFGEFLFHVGVGGLGVELGLNSCEESAFLLRDAEALEGFENIGGNIIPRTLRLFPVGEVEADFVVVDVFEILGRPVRGCRLAFENGERFVAELAHPIGILLHVADVIDSRGGKTPSGVELIALRKGEIALRAVDVDRFVRFLVEEGGGCVFCEHGKVVSER